VQLDAVEPGGLRVLGSAPEGLDDLFYLVSLERAGNGKSAQGSQKGDVAGRSDRAGSHGELAVEKRWIGDAAHVPYLREDAPAGVVDSFGDGLPGLDLLLRPEAGNVRITDAQRIDGGAFGEDEPG